MEECSRFCLHLGCLCPDLTDGLAEQHGGGCKCRILPSHQTKQRKSPDLINCGARATDQYRLCPLSETLTEKCFQQRPLPFARAVALEWQNGSRLEIEGRYLSEGTIPAGSAWARNPMPYSNPHTPPEFDPPCDEKPDAWKTETGVCSGRYLTNVSIVSQLTTLYQL